MRCSMFCWSRNGLVTCKALEMKDSFLILEKYPYLLPRCNARIWEGFLYAGFSEVKIRIDVPHFPSLKNAVVYTTPFLLKELKELTEIESHKSLFHLINNISSLLPFNSSGNLSHFTEFSFDRVKSILKDFDEIGKDSILEVENDFEGALLAYQDIRMCIHKLKLVIPREYGESALVVSEVDLPDEALPQLRNMKRLPDVFEAFKVVIESLMPFWEMCEDLEEEAWVVDPQVSKKQDTHRRVYLNDKVSVVLTFNPTDLESFPQIQFMGSMQAVAEARENCQKKFEEYGWDSDLSVIDNLTTLLGIDSFPKKPNPSETNGNVGQDCFICFSTALDNEPPPSKWCPNDKCSSIYHFSCLLKWLESVPTSKLGFDHISGSCPYCNEKIMCPISS